MIVGIVEPGGPPDRREDLSVERLFRLVIAPAPALTVAIHVLASETLAKPSRCRSKFGGLTLLIAWPCQASAFHALIRPQASYLSLFVWFDLRRQWIVSLVQARPQVPRTDRHRCWSSVLHSKDTTTTPPRQIRRSRPRKDRVLAQRIPKSLAFVFAGREATHQRPWKRLTFAFAFV